MSRGMIRTLILVPLLLIVLVALFLLLRPSSTTQESASTPESTGTQGADKTFDLAIKGASAMSPDQVSVNQGDHVNLRITSDESLSSTCTATTSKKSSKQTSQESFRSTQQTLAASGWRHI